MVPATSVVILFVCWLTFSYGRVFTDVEQDYDDGWPVLCPPDTFYSQEQDQCLNCSRCPMNKIITSPCHGLHDTKCGPFYDFQNILPADAIPVADDDNLAHQNGGKNSDFRNNNNFNSNKSAMKLDYYVPDVNMYEYTERETDLRQTSSDSVEFSYSEFKWLTIPITVLVSIFFIVVTSFIIFILRKKCVNEKKIVWEYSSPPEYV